MKHHAVLATGLLMLGLTGCMPAAKSPNWTATPGPAGTTSLISATGQPIKMALTPRFAVQEGDVFGGVELVGQMGVWVLRQDRTRADVDGLKVQGRSLREPVNVVMVDLFAKSPQEALLRVTSALDRVGLNPADGYTHGYQAYLNGDFAPEVPAGQTFARGLGTAREERLRLFGPWKYGEGYVFLAGIAAQNVTGQGRSFSDFMVTREDLAEQLNTRTPFRKKGYVDLLSKVDTPRETTADHDGCAVVFVARE
ncbi:hypothetical protein WDJ50_11495 [Deinococcus sp. VB142]|uniref:Uncharacterized protein n=1 Tax=Deinococcus sp. VB142 TaxID=3112952 RepID=A0AAU6Q1E9_9DEIO